MVLLKLQEFTIRNSSAIKENDFPLADTIIFSVRSQRGRHVRSLSYDLPMVPMEVSMEKTVHMVDINGNYMECSMEVSMINGSFNGIYPWFSLSCHSSLTATNTHHHTSVPCRVLTAPEEWSSSCSVRSVRSSTTVSLGFCGKAAKHQVGTIGYHQRRSTTIHTWDKKHGITVYMNWMI